MLNLEEMLQTSTTSIGSFFKGGFFAIPVNQREYRWKAEQREKLWDDLLYTIEQDFLKEEGYPRGHFLGAVVAVGRQSSSSMSRWQIIDGQQRLTTLTIIASCLQEYVESIQGDRQVKKVLGHLIDDCIFAPEADSAPRLKLNRENDFYNFSLTQFSHSERVKYWEMNFDKKSEVQANIKDAFEYYDHRIQMFLEAAESKVEALKYLVEAITKNFYILFVRVSNLPMAYRLFETLNERGLELSQADLIKNTLLQHAREEGDQTHDEAAELWSAFLDLYESQPAKKLEVPQLIQFSYTSRHRKTKKEELFDFISRDLYDARVPALALAHELAEDASQWVAFLTGDLINWSEKIADSQSAIIDPLWKAHVAPYILAVMNRYAHDKSAMEKLLMYAEHYLFRQGLVCRDSVASLQDFFSSCCSLLRADCTVREMSDRFKEGSPTKNFVDCFKVASVKNMKQGFYVIWKIECFLDSQGSHEFRPRMQSAAQHVEHILPRKPSSEWGGVETLEAFSAYVNRIGNFLILPSSVNGHIKNASIGYKMENESEKDYKSISDRFNLVREFIENFDSWSGKSGSWSFESISDRQNHLAVEYAERVWSFD
jgi:hypothetical protein